MKKTLKRHELPETITSDGLRSYRAAMSELGNAERQGSGAGPTAGGDSNLPFRRRERAMRRFRPMKMLQKFASFHATPQPLHFAWKAVRVRLTALSQQTRCTSSAGFVHDDVRLKTT